MARNVVGGLIQCATPSSTTKRARSREIATAMFEKHLPFIEEAGQEGRPDPLPPGDLQRPVLLPEPGPALVRRRRGRARARPSSASAQYAKKYQMAMVVPVYEREMAGVYYNTAAVIDADGTYLGKYRKNHIPHTTGFWEKYFFKPGNLGYPIVPDALRDGSASTSATTATSPRARALLGLNGAEIVFNPSATVAGPLAVPLEARAARARGRERLLRRRAATASAPRRRGTSASSTARATSSTRAATSSPQASEDKDELVVADAGPRHDRGGPAHVAVLPRPPARDVRGPRARASLRSRRMSKTL